MSERTPRIFEMGRNTPCYWRSHPLILQKGTWIESEDFATHSKTEDTMKRYAKCINAMNGKHIVVRCGFTNQFLGTEAIGGTIFQQFHDGKRYLAYFPRSMHTDRKTGFTIGDVVDFKTRMKKTQQSVTGGIIKEWRNFEMFMTCRGVVVGIRTCRDEKETYDGMQIKNECLRSRRFLLVATTISGAPHLVEPSDVVIVCKNPALNQVPNKPEREESATNETEGTTDEA